MYQRPRDMARAMMNGINAFYTKANPQSLKTIHIVLFEPSMVNDFKVTVQEKFKALQVFP